jgi:hypothetical protein
VGWGAAAGVGRRTQYLPAPAVGRVESARVEGVLRLVDDMRGAEFCILINDALVINLTLRGTSVDLVVTQIPR